MDTSYNFILRFARASDLKVQTPDRPLSRRTLQRIATRMSLVSLALGFWVFAMLIVINRHQAELNGLSGGSSVAIVGGIGAFLVGMVFLVAACLHRRFCVRHPIALPVRRQSARITLSRPDAVMPFVLLAS